MMGALLSSSIPRQARWYVWGMTLLGLPTLVYCLYQSLFHSDLRWLYLAVLAVLGSLFPVNIPSLRKGKESLSVSVSDIFVFLAILFFNPEVAASVSVLDAFILNLTGRVRRLYKQLFNLSEAALVSLLAGHLFYQLQGTSPPLEPGEVEMTWLFLNLGFSALIYFLLNSSAVALAISLVSRKPFLKVILENFQWAPLTTIAGAPAAALIFLNFERNQVLAFGIALPVVLVIYYAYQMNLNRIQQAQRHLAQMDEIFHSTIASLAMAIDAKDQSTHGHIYRVQALALGLARFHGVQDEDELKGLRAASLLHDIGKLAIPEYILNKPTRLTKAEMLRMKTHPTVGAEILASVPFPYPVAPLVRHHHEKWDGTGYPDGLKAEEIPLGSRILAIADCYDALRSDRPYRAKLSRDVALEYIRTEAGRSYDPAIVNTLIQHIDELEEEIARAEGRTPQGVSHTLEGEAAEAGNGHRPSSSVFQDIASAHREIQAVYEISHTVGKSLSISETLNLLATRIRDLVPFACCAIFLNDSERSELVPSHTSGAFSELMENLRIPIGEGVSGWVAVNNQSLINVSPSPDFSSYRLLAEQFKSCLCVPLSNDNSVVGVVTLYADKPEAFLDDHLRIMESIAPHAATALNNAILYEETQEDAYTDLLTGLPNLRYFNAFIDQELKRAGRIQYPVTILMMDLDHFKEVNDQYGHQVGDRILIEIAHILRNQMRKSDTCVRYGGDEFVAILPGVTSQQAVQTVERIQSAVQEHRTLLENGKSVSAGISIGTATFPEDGRDKEILLAAADRTMYRNKSSRGRQRREALTSAAGQAG